MMQVGEHAFRLLCSVAIGLLMGAERERHKGQGPSREAAGIRTFALAALLGGVSTVLGGNLTLAVVTSVVALLSAAAYLQSHKEDPGLPRK